MKNHGNMITLPMAMNLEATLVVAKKLLRLAPLTSPKVPMLLIPPIVLILMLAVELGSPLNL